MNKKKIVAGLRNLGLKNGDAVLLHSSLISLGRVEGGPDAVIDAFLEVLGADGTLLVPVFGALGILTETLKKREGAVISPCPVGTLAALGPKAAELCRDHWQAATVHGKDTPFTRLAELGGYICLLGVDQDRNTTLHSVEALLELPYLADSTRTFVTPEGETVTKTWKYYPGPHRDFIGLDRYFRESGVIRTERLGNAEVRLIKSQDLFDISLKIGRSNPAFVLCGNPACADCVKQRAMIFADRMAGESFKLSASSRLAGRYLPEILENLKAAGIRYLELDYLQGKACAAMPPDKLAAVVEEVREAGCEVSALRVPWIADNAAHTVTAAREAGIGRLVIPIGADELLKQAAEAGLECAFFNSIQTGTVAADYLRERSAASCFNPANFVMAGEKPFLVSYRLGRFIKLMDQLDIVDCTWDGSPAGLAQGNAEIKELISILRCHNFNGWFCLSGPGPLKEAVAAFTRLLDNM